MEKELNRFTELDCKNIITSYDISKSDDTSCLTIGKLDESGITVLASLYDQEADIVNAIIDTLTKENNILKHRLNDVVFKDANNDVELAARYLRKIGYVGFDEESKTYINLHNNEPFWNEDEREKDYYIKDEELDEYTKHLEHELKEKNRILKEIYNRCDQMSAEIEEVEGSYSYYFKELKGLLPIDREKAC